jgi:hypothetical protein
MAKKVINITTPVGRMIGGSLYDPETTDYDGKPLTAKDKVTPRVNYSIGIAIPKTPGVAHWGSEAWGAPIWALAHEVFINGETQRHDFAWKITDGDSTIPNKRQRKPCDREGYPGHWVLWFSGGFAPQAYNNDGSQKLLEKDAIKPGYYIQVFGSISDNQPSQSPGLYLNHTYVALSAYGEEINVGPDVTAAGFGHGVALPPGASATPTGNFTPAPPGATTVTNGVPPVPGATAVTVPTPTIPVVPNTAILQPPAQPVRKLTELAKGATYEQLIAAKWTDELLIANGIMLP